MSRLTDADDPPGDEGHGQSMIKLPGIQQRQRSLQGTHLSKVGPEGLELDHRVLNRPSNPTGGATTPNNHAMMMSSLFFSEAMAKFLIETSAAAGSVRRAATVPKVNVRCPETPLEYPSRISHRLCFSGTSRNDAWRSQLISD